MDVDLLPEVRREIRRALYLRRAGVHKATHIKYSVNHRAQLSLTEAEVKTELKYLSDKGHVKSHEDPDGGTVLLYELTPDGINFCEANDLVD